jgi:hypothetical protein
VLPNGCAYIHRTADAVVLEMRDGKYAVLGADGPVLSVEQMRPVSDVFALARAQSSCGGRAEWN